MDEVQVDVVETETLGLASIAPRARSDPCSLFHSFVVMNSSSRGMPLAAIARPTPSSFP